ncbi:MAG: YgcG family protein [Clostridiales bacterium]|jgi:uncharacterized protein|nr:YgcG family protein [Clostridiales bacterium]
MIFKRLFAGLFALLIISGVVFAMPSPTNGFYVNDFANILSEADRSDILSRATAFNAQNGAQIVVVTVTSLEGQTIEQYANQLFNSWGIGDKDVDNGVLFLVAADERKMRIEVGYGLEGVLTDGTTGYILDEYVVPDFKQNNYSAGIIKGFDKILETISGDFVAPQTKNESAIKVLQLFREIGHILTYLCLWGMSLLLFVCPLWKKQLFNKKMNSPDIPTPINAVSDKNIIKKAKKNSIIWVILGIVLFVVIILLSEGFALLFALFYTLIVAGSLYTGRKYRCPNCSSAMQFKHDVEYESTYHRTGQTRVYFHCPNCQNNYQDVILLPMKQARSSGGSSGGWSVGGGGGGSFGGGGSSGGGGASRGW